MCVICFVFFHLRPSGTETVVNCAKLSWLENSQVVNNFSPIICETFARYFEICFFGNSTRIDLIFSFRSGRHCGAF